MNLEEITIKEFDLQSMEPSCTWIMVGPPASGKTTLIENICFYNKHKYPVARAFVGTPSAYKKFCDIFGKLYVTNWTGGRSIPCRSCRHSWCRDPKT